MKNAARIGAELGRRHGVGERLAIESDRRADHAIGAGARVTELLNGSERAGLFAGEDLGDVLDLRCRNARLGERREPLGARPASEVRLELLGQLVAVAHPRRVVAEASVGD